MLSLRWKLAAALLLVVLVSVGLTAFLTNLSTGREFNQYISQGYTLYARNVSDELGRFWAEKHGWTGLQPLLSGLLRSGNDRLVVADSSGMIVGDTGQDWLGKRATEIGLSDGVTIAASGQPVGTLYPLMYGGGVGGGMMGGMMGGRMGGWGMMGGGHMVLDTAAQDFLDRSNQSLLIAGTIAGVVALLLGLVLTRQVTRPIRALTAGAGHVARGDLAYRVSIGSRDELGNLADSFNRMASSLDRAEQARRRFTADIAHELRTPLTIIEGTVNGILDGVFTPDKERLEAIKDQTALLARLISDLRDLSLADSGQLKLQLSPTDIAELLRRKISEFELAARQKSIELKLEAPHTLPEIKVDAGRIEQVIANLLNNAIRHTPPGGTITVSARSDPSEGLVIAVADTGEGIPAEHLPRLFDRFYRVGDSRARSEGGTGLGLAIVKQMVEAHGGKVRVESQVGKGSTFYVALPVA